MDPKNNDGNAQPNLNNNNGGDGKGTAPKQPDNPTPPSVDFTKIGDEDFTKVFDDPRVWNHPRFKNLNDRAKKADELEAAQRKAEEDRLVEQGKFKELATTKENEANEWKNKFTQTQIDNKVAIEASKAGVVDVEAVLKLIDRTKVTINSDGTIIGVDTAVAELLTSKPYLKNGNPIQIGGGTNPGGGSNVVKFKLSQLQDARFYREHEKEIAEARKAGQIENDMPGMIG